MTEPDQAANDRAEIDELRARAAVDLSMIAQLQADSVEDRNKIADLEQALATSGLIGTAIGILMSQHDISSDAAFGMLTEVSQHQNRPIGDLADDVVAYGTL